ncbi:hypothetical protein [Desulfovibrio sp. TomC]|uniref:hypothetical protein n=1 Tax=Desulfovibrio sp. TomC TaxID=1562888 RepID=UPI000574241D|nr:hypothetical protein [Desulfovibrio sp. TomC]KHK00405.1 hypothetical protein NY78_4154 [Desulfovibrio sp. TomC]
MNTHSGLPAMPADLRNAVLSNYTTFSEDGTLCYVSDKVHRSCTLCGTVFAGSISRMAIGDGYVCPYCGVSSSKPMPESWYA